MNAIPLLLIVIILLLLYNIIYVHGKETPINSPKTVPKNPIENKKTASVIGKTNTTFPSRRTERKPEEADENRTQKPPTFVSESPSETNGNEFNPMPSENEIDMDDVEREELDILFGEDIEVSGESLTTKEIRQIQQAVKRNTVSEQEKPDLLKTAEKLQGSDFLEKLKSHETLQSRLNVELMQLLSGNEKSAIPTETLAEDWTSFL